MNSLSKRCVAVCLLALLSLLVPVPALPAGNGVLGQVDLLGATKVEETSGVWIDGQYVGYLRELKGSKKILLLPGEHEITIRQGGYMDFVQKVTVRAGETQTINVKLEKDTRIQLPRITAEIKLEVNPNRAAVFVDGVFVGHVAEFGGIGRALLVTPGKRKITISLPGYQTFETDIDLVPNQKSTVKTDLVKVAPRKGFHCSNNRNRNEAGQLRRRWRQGLAVCAASLQTTRPRLRHDCGRDQATDLPYD